MYYVLCAAVGYLLGCINTAFIIGKLRGFDIRKAGTGNAGASNAAVTMGFKTAVFVAVCDILKAALAYIICKKLFPDTECAGVIGAVGAILGHMYPVWMGFKGGKGLACFMGMILAMSWKMFLVFGAAVVIITLVTDYIAIGTIVASVVYPAYIYIISSAWIQPAIIGAATVLILIKHRENIKRIISGKEIGLRKTMGVKQ